MKTYAVGVIYYFQADDAEHALDQLEGELGVDIRGHVNILEIEGE